MQPMVAWQGVGEEDKYTAVTILSSLAPTGACLWLNPVGTLKQGNTLTQSTEVSFPGLGA